MADDDQAPATLMIKRLIRQLERARADLSPYEAAQAFGLPAAAVDALIADLRRLVALTENELLEAHGITPEDARRNTYPDQSRSPIIEDASGQDASQGERR